MKKALFLFLFICLIAGLFCNAVSAEDIFSLLETPIPSASPSTHIDVSSGNYLQGEIVSQDIFEALQFPDPTPFPTPPSRINSKSSKSSGEYSFLLMPDGSAQIIAYYGKDMVLNIPSKLGAYSVRSIGISALANSKNLTEVVLPEGVTSIGEWAFGNCKNLTTVMIPASVKTIDSFAFAGCSSLSFIRIPAGVTEIADNAFDREQSDLILTIELEKGSYAEKWCGKHNYIISYYVASASPAMQNTVATPTPSLAQKPVSTPTSTPPYSFSGNNQISGEYDCPTCGGVGGCPNHCLYGEIHCPDCVTGRCIECGGDGENETYNYAKNDVRRTKCRTCGGSGKCRTCKGEARIQCKVCHGTGHCPTCGR